jgi:hypothetical protein
MSCLKFIRLTCLILLLVHGCATTPQTTSQVERFFFVRGISTVVVRAAEIEDARIKTVADAQELWIRAQPAGGVTGYHSPDPNWRETPAADYGMDFVEQRYGDTLVVSSHNEIEHIHHHYYLKNIVVTVPKDITVIREKRVLSGNGAADLSPPRL